MRRTAIVVGFLIASLGAAACTPPPGGGGTRYVDPVFPNVASTTNVTYATAPDLVTGQPVALKLDWYQPAGDSQQQRPAIVWIHGGGFRVGGKGATTATATEYAQRGYVTLSINYRLDPGNRCQDVQDGVITDPAEYERELARCRAAVVAAQHDAQAVVRWVRANAATLGVDPAKIAAGGFSAGAITAVHVGQRSHDPGDVGDNDGFDSRIGVALAASGCNYEPESIGAGDAPVSLLASEFDQAVPFSCVTETADRTEAAGIDVQRIYYLGQGGHAKALYDAHKAEVDAQWTAFLVEQLGLA